MFSKCGFPSKVGYLQEFRNNSNVLLVVCRGGVAMCLQKRETYSNVPLGELGLSNVHSKLWSPFEQCLQNRRASCNWILGPHQRVSETTGALALFHCEWGLALQCVF